MQSALLFLALLAADPRAAAAPSAAGTPSQPVDAVVVCPKEFMPALEPLLAHRYRQGHRFMIVNDPASADEIRATVRKVAKDGALKHVLLVGDADPNSTKDVAKRLRTVPTHHAQAEVNVKYGSEPELATDNWYADLDDDRVPDVAIGRLPVDTSAELSIVVAKILDYEQQLGHGEWRQRINMVAGVGGFGGLVDGVIESATRKFLTDGIPAAYTTNMTYGSWRSPYCPDPRRFHEVAVQRHNEGCLFWVYIGHGQVTELDRVAVPGGRFHIFDNSNCGELTNANGSPIAVMLACYTGAFDLPEDCLGEQMLKAKGGPVAVYAGSRVTMPYAMAVMGSEMLGEYFRDRPPTLGEVVLNAKRRMVTPIDETKVMKSGNRLLLEAVASLMSPNREQMAAERLEHAQLFNLLGDPMLRVAYPDKVEVDAPRHPSPGERIVVQGKSPIAGDAVVQLVCRRDMLKTDTPQRERFDPSNAGLAELQGDYLKANDHCWVRQVVPVKAGQFSTEIEVPADCRGACHVQVFVAGEGSHAMGAANLYVRRPTPSSGATPATTEPAIASELPEVVKPSAVKPRPRAAKVSASIGDGVDR